MTETEEKNNKVFVGLYITFCVLFITWLTTKFFKGRRQMHQAFDTIGIQLQRMQDQLDQRRDAEDSSRIEYSNGNEAEKLCPLIENDSEKVESDSEKIDTESEKEKLKDE